MKISRILSLSTLAVAAIFLAACASNGPSISGNWQDIGTTSNGNIKASIDKSSIKRSGNLVTFRDKKTVVKTSEERYVNTPTYKTAVGTWEINCSNKTYRLSALQLLDDHGKVLINETYSSTDIRPMSVMKGTLTEKQYEAICSRSL